jgi:EAL domain-containing protein (putative c-di-GMP-specific phosphodiesterase class I)
MGSSNVAYFIFLEEIKRLMHQNVENEFGYSITHWFQPIYSLKNNNIVGYEALMRDASELKASPVDIFKEAEKNGQRSTLDRKSIKNATESFKHGLAPLFINVFPATLLEKDFISWWDISISNPTPVVLELLESEPVDNWEALKEITNKLKKRGVKIAVDDMGGGYSFFQQWIELAPDFIKLDRYFAQNLSVSSKKQKTISSMVDLFSGSTEIIIEGIEKEEDLNIAGFLGIPYAQGFLLGKPSPKEDIL